MTELEPFCIFFDHAQPPVAMWQPAMTQQPAVALFSTAAKAEAYAGQRGNGQPGDSHPGDSHPGDSACRIAQLSELELVRLLAELFAQGVTHAALDPEAGPDAGPAQGTARSLFDLKLVLKAARERLQASRADASQ